MARDYPRSHRLSEQLTRLLAKAVQQEIRDPRLGLVNISQVQLSDDLSMATVLVSTLQLEQMDQKLSILNGAAPFLRRYLGQHLRTRYIPKLRFKFDAAPHRADRIAQLLAASGAGMVAEDPR